MSNNQVPRMSRPKYARIAALLIFIMGGVMIFAMAQVVDALPPPAALPEQCANGDMNQYPDCRQTGNHGWKNSQVNTNNGQYWEDVFIPYRQYLENLVPGETYCFGFSWDVSQGGLPAIDFLASYDEGPASADPTFQTIHDGTGPDDTIAIPVDPVPTTSYWMLPANTFTGTMPAVREFTLWGATWVSVGPYSNPGGTDMSLAAYEENSIEYCIQAIDDEAVIAFSGHISRPEEWQAPNRPGGSPYHMANGTKQGLFTAPRTSETDLVCATCTPVEHQNIGRAETQLQVGEPPVTAIQLRQVSTSSLVFNPLVWVGILLALSGFVFAILRVGKGTDQVS